MAVEITMPKLSDTMEEGKIIKWLVSEGDEVSSGDVIAEIETDKADMEFEVIEDGFIKKILIQEGEQAPVGTLIAIMTEEEDEEVDTETSDSVESEATEEVDEEEAVEESVDEEPVEESEQVEEVEEVVEAEPEPEKEKEPVEVQQDAIEEKPAAVSTAGSKASPVARKLAAEAGIDINQIPGSGPDGRVIKRDVEQVLGVRPTDEEEPEQVSVKSETQPEVEAVPVAAKLEEKPKPVEKIAAVVPKPVPTLEAKRVPMSGMRKTISKRLVESKVSVPHFYLTMEVNMAPVMDTRKALLEQENTKLSVNDFIVKACAKALTQHPLVNAHIEGDEIVYNDTVDVGVAVALEEGLITPYIRDAHNKTLTRISSETKELAGRARSRKLKPEEYSGGSMTISNLGMFDIDAFTAIINPPEATILAVGKVKETPVVNDGQIEIGQRMNMTLSCDHRTVDGAVGARFLADVKEILEHPLRMLV